MKICIIYFLFCKNFSKYKGNKIFKYFFKIIQFVFHLINKLESFSSRRLVKKFFYYIFFFFEMEHLIILSRFFTSLFMLIYDKRKMKF